MSRRIVLGVFEREEDILGATRTARASGLRVVDAYTPYAVHGLDQAMGLGPSRLPWFCFAMGLLGAGLKLWFEIWTAAVDWPLNVGGKPWNSLPAFVPVTFEVMVLFAGLGAVFAFFLIARLLPGRKARMIYPGITDDRFVLVLEESDAAFDLAKVTRMFEKFHVIATEERLEEETA